MQKTEKKRECIYRHWQGVALLPCPLFHAVASYRILTDQNTSEDKTKGEGGGEDGKGYLWPLQTFKTHTAPKEDKNIFFACCFFFFTNACLSVGHRQRQKQETRKKCVANRVHTR